MQVKVEVQKEVQTAEGHGASASAVPNDTALPRTLDKVASKWRAPRFHHDRPRLVDSEELSPYQGILFHKNVYLSANEQLVTAVLNTEVDSPDLLVKSSIDDLGMGLSLAEYLKKLGRTQVRGVSVQIVGSTTCHSKCLVVPASPASALVSEAAQEDNG